MLLLWQLNFSHFWSTHYPRELILFCTYQSNFKQIGSFKSFSKEELREYYLKCPGDTWTGQLVCTAAHENLWWTVNLLAGRFRFADNIDCVLFSNCWRGFDGCVVSRGVGMNRRKVRTKCPDTVFKRKYRPGVGTHVISVKFISEA